MLRVFSNLFSCLVKVYIITITLPTKYQYLCTPIHSALSSFVSPLSSIINFKTILTHLTWLLKLKFVNCVKFPKESNEILPQYYNYYLKIFITQKLRLLGKLWPLYSFNTEITMYCYYKILVIHYKKVMIENNYYQIGIKEKCSNVKGLCIWLRDRVKSRVETEI